VTAAAQVRLHPVNPEDGTRCNGILTIGAKHSTGRTGWDKVIRLRTVFSTVLIAAIMAAGAVANAANVTIPHTFVPGDPALAAEVNANFQAVKAAVDDNDRRIAELFGSAVGRLVVSKSNGDFSTISAALASVTPTAASPVVIDVLPGTFVENVVLKSFVHLRGSGRDVTTVQAANPDLPVITINQLQNVAVTGLALTGGLHGIDIRNALSIIAIQSNTIVANVQNGINNIASSPRIDENLIVANGFHGIFNDNNAEPLITDNVIAFNFEDGVNTHSSNPVLVSNGIIKNADGIKNTDDSRPVIVGNLIEDNSNNGIHNRDLNAISQSEADVTTIAANRIRNNDENGILNDNSSPRIVSNVIEEQKPNNKVPPEDNHGILNINNSNPVIGANMIAFNPQAGILNVNSSPTIVANGIVANQQGGILNEDSAPSIQGNRISLNGVVGVRIAVVVALPARPMVLHNRITQNGPPDVEIVGTPADLNRPNISFNIYDVIVGADNALGGFNLNSAGVEQPPFAQSQRNALGLP
jgi:hypothetical protein